MEMMKTFGLITYSMALVCTFLVGTMVAETVLASAVKAVANDVKERIMSTLPVMLLTKVKGKKMQEQAYLSKNCFSRVQWAVI